MKIGNHTIKYPIIQGGMGIGCSLDNLAGNVSVNGGLGVVATVGTGYYKNGKFIQISKKGIPRPDEFNSIGALKDIISSAKEISKNKPIAVNVMVALSNYEEVLYQSCKAGADIIISGAGLPMKLPSIKENYPDIAIVPIISNVKVLRILLKRWKGLYKKEILPDAIIIEGPKSGGHQGVNSIEACFLEENQLESTVPPVIEYLKKNNLDIPVFAAGGIWDKEDIEKYQAMGCTGVQMGTRFLATYESDASDTHKNLLVKCKEKDIKIGKSPVGYPSRRIVTNLHSLIDNNIAPKISCISNCVTDCNHGEKAKEVGYCIADRLADAYNGNISTGLFFTGSNGHRVNEIISVKQLMDELIHGKK